MMPQWVEIEPLLKARIETLVLQLETHGKSVEDTEFVRGKIAAFREVLALPNRTAPVSRPIFGQALTMPDGIAGY